MARRPITIPLWPIKILGACIAFAGGYLFWLAKMELATAPMGSLAAGAIATVGALMAGGSAGGKVD